MKKIILSLFVLTLLAGFSVTEEAWSKAHVPISKVQVCEDGITKTVSDNALGAQLANGNCRLPACDFSNIFVDGSECPADNVGAVDEDGNDVPDGFCDVANVRSSADGVTPQCSPAF